MFTADPGSQQDLNQAPTLHVYLYSPQYPPQYGTSCILYSGGDIVGAQYMHTELTVYTNSTHQIVNSSIICVGI